MKTPVQDTTGGADAANWGERVRIPAAVERLCARVRGWACLAGALGGLALLGGGCWLLAVLDAGLILPEGLRVWLPWLLLILSLGLAGRLALRGWAAGKIVRRCERRYPQAGSRLSNAVELADAVAADAYGEVLRRQALQEGAAMAATLRAWPVMAGRVRRALLALGACALPWGVLALVLPELLAAVLPRLADPRGDHPPFAFRTIELTVPAEAMVYGAGCEVRAVVRGAPCERLYLYSRPAGEEAGAARRPGEDATAQTILFRRSDGSYTIALTNLREPLWVWAGDGRSRSRVGRIGVRYTPLITRVELLATYPAYTGLKPGPVVAQADGIRLPKGTRLRVVAHSNRALGGGELQLAPLTGKARQAALAPVAAQDNAVEAELTLEEGFSWSLSVTGRDGLACAKPAQGTILIRPDEPPSVFVLEPGRDAVATPDSTIRFAVRGEDDYGIAALLNFRGINGTTERSVALSGKRQESARVMEAEGAFRLAELGVRPGDAITYFFEAADNDPAGPNIASSRLYHLRIIAQEEYERILREYAARRALFTEYYALTQNARRLAERVEQLEQSLRETKGVMRPEDARELEQIRQELERLQKKLAQSLRDPGFFDIDRQFKQKFSAQQERLAAAQRALEKTPATGQSLQEVRQQLRAVAGQMQQEVANPAHELAAVAQLLYLAQQYALLAQGQGELARKAQHLRDKAENDRQARMEQRELADRERVVIERLTELRRKMQQALQELPEDARYDKLKKTAWGFLTGFEELAVITALEEANRAFLSGKNGPEAAEQAARKMLALVSRCKSLAPDGQMCLQFNPSLSEGLGNSLQQILQAMSNGGSGQNDGYSMFQEDVALFGPQSHLAGNPESDIGKGEGESGNARAQLRQSSTPSGKAPGKGANGSLAVQPQREAKCPLLYRRLAGDYFRAVVEGAVAAETPQEGAGSAAGTREGQ